MPSQRREFEEGVATGAAVGGLLVLAALTLLVPTNEFRVRVFVLLEHPGDATLHAMLGVALLAGSVVTLAVMRGLTRWRLGGTAAAVALHLCLLAQGAWRWLPEFPHRVVGAGTCLLGVGLVVLALRPLRRAIVSGRRHTAGVDAAA